MEQKKWNCTPSLFSQYICLANDNILSTITYDTLVRAGISCTSAYVTSDSSAPGAGAVPTPVLACKGSRGIKIVPDASFPRTKFSSGVSFDVSERVVVELYLQEKYDILVIPGGAQGAATLSKSAAVQELVREFIKDDKIVGMICAGAWRSRRETTLFSCIILLVRCCGVRKPNSAHLKTPAPTADLPSKR
jgi:putative intracellular protease/amidase